MIQLKAKEKINCSTEELFDKLANLDKIYTKYCPDEHIICKYIKGDPLTIGSVLYFEEYIGNKLNKMKYKVKNVIDNRIVVFQAMFPRSLFNIKLFFTIEKQKNCIHFERNIHVGFKSKKIGKFIDNFIIKILGESYYNEMICHNKKDLKLLKNYIELN